LALVEQTGEQLWAAELHRLRGEIMLRDAGMGDHGSSEAEQELLKAVSIAEAQKAKALEQRSAESLASLAQFKS
jgi:predicted ATPase